MARTTETSTAPRGGAARDDRLGLVLIALCVVGSLAACGAWLTDELDAKGAWSAAAVESSADVDRAL